MKAIEKADDKKIASNHEKRIKKLEKLAHQPRDFVTCDCCKKKMKEKQMKGSIKEMIVEYIFNEEMEGKIIKALNDNIDIPILSEKTEEKILKAVYSSVEEVIKDAIMKD